MSSNLRKRTVLGVSDLLVDPRKLKGEDGVEPDRLLVGEESPSIFVSPFTVFGESVSLMEHALVNMMEVSYIGVGRGKVAPITLGDSRATCLTVPGPFIVGFQKLGLL
jgi:hypothetical protein